MNSELILILISALLLAALVTTILAYMKAQKKAQKLEFDLLHLDETVDRITQEIENYKQRDAKWLETEKRASALEQQIKHYQEREGQREQELKNMQTQFENLANKIFDAKQQAFREQSEKGLDTILKPLKERFSEFQKKVDETYGHHAKEQHHLKQEIARIIEMNQAMKLQTENLTNALKGDVKVQGTWGEIILEKILEASGLRKGEHYTLQGEGMGLKHVESGGHLKPDVIVHLPENKHLIIDSKVSLTHYERACGEADEASRTLHIKQFIASIRSHISGLESKRYQDVQGLGTPDFVLMFMPIESAYVQAIQLDQDLHSFAWDKRIFLVSPSTLYPILRTVASIWRMDLQNKNALEIAQQSGNLYDKVVGFVKEFEDIGSRLDQAKDSYNTALNRLSTGKGNILTRAENIRLMGAKTSKQLPAHLIEKETEQKESA